MARVAKEKEEDKNMENSIEWLTNQKQVTISLSQTKYITKLKKYAQSHPDEVDYIENEDKTICAHIPLTWIKISPKKRVTREVTPEKKKELSERMKAARAKKK